MLLFQAQSCPPFRHGRIEHCCCGRENQSCANPKTLPHYVRTDIDGESLESFTIHFPPLRIEAQSLWKAETREVQRTFTLFLHPTHKDKQRNEAQHKHIITPLQ